MNMSMNPNPADGCISELKCVNEASASVRSGSRVRVKHAMIN